MNANITNFYNLKRKAIRINSYKSAFISFIFLLFLSSLTLTQELPDKLRGYKVHKAKINVQNNIGESKPKDADAIVSMDDPQPTSVSLTGLTFEISGAISTLKQNGHVDFLTFKDFKVNDLSVDIEEYQESFDFEKNQLIRLPRPIRISLGFGQAMRGVFGEWRDSKPFWQVTGRVFVFGHFKKFGLKFKRAVPIDISLQIKNPLNKQ